MIINMHAHAMHVTGTVIPACRVIGCGVRPGPQPPNGPPYCACDAACSIPPYDCCDDYNALCNRGAFWTLIAVKVYNLFVCFLDRMAG